MSGRAGVTARRGAAVLVVLVLALGLSAAACGSPAQNARQEAVSAVRAKAFSLREDLAAAARGSSGKAQLEAVAKALPDLALVARAEGEAVIVSGAITAGGESGGGLSYEQFVARLCLTYRIQAMSGHTEVSDAACPSGVGALAPADRDVRLGD
ncbi:MAG TPA: hypothetical protein VGB75_18795 [Jatrophihabitans sp.]|jgi:hypothetical protein|uniref:hypothetical protein n=1 Tax=Jatrophihabitans sp. TaxID=1932789 RepID=UPI002F10D5AD